MARRVWVLLAVLLITLSTAQQLNGQNARSLQPTAVTGAPDPTLLPVATSSQTPQTGAYNALNVPGMAAGSSYLDPLTAVKIYKLTSASFPTSGNNWGHDYMEGGDEVSLPYNGNTRTILVRGSSVVWWLVDFTPGVGVSNPRQLTGNFTPVADGAFAFSSNPSTPYYAYVSNGGSTIRRFDVRTMAEVPGNGWPVTDSGTGPFDWPLWLHQTENDVFFTWMRGANGDTVVGYEPSTGTKKTYTNSGLNEPRIDRDPNDRFICISMSTPQNQALFWDWNKNVITWSSPLYPGFNAGQPPVAHQASLHGYWTGVDWNASAPFPLWKISATPNSVVDPLPGGQGPGSGHCNGSWNQHPANANDQWFACYVYGVLAPPPSEGEVAPGGILLSTANGQRRILAHLYNTATDYFSYSFVKLSSDGAYALFTSNMNGSSRADVFLAEMPTGGMPPPPPPPPDTTPPTVPTGLTAKPVSSTQINLTWNASTDPDSAVSGYKVYRNGAQIGTSATTSYSDTGLSPSTTYTYTVSSYDPAGNNSAQCAGVNGTTQALPPPPPPSDTTPPTVPTGLTTNPVSSSQINLSWNASSDPDSAVSGYKVYRNGAQIGTSATTSYSDTGLLPSTTYTYTVSAYDPAANNSAQCAGVNGTTQALPPPPPPTGGMIAFLHLDENAGSTLFADASGSGNNGSCSGTGCPTAGVAGKVGKAVSFNGTSNLISIANNSGLNAYPLTVETWFKTGSTTGVVGLVNKYVAGSYNGYNVFLNNGNVCAWYLRDSSNYVYDGTGCTFNIAGYNNNAWHQVVYVVDSSGGKLYLDGVQKGTTIGWTGTSGSPTTTQDVQLGHYPGAFGGVEYFTGLLDEVRIYNKALTASDVSSLYNSDNAPPADTTAPTVPTGLNATPVSPSQINLSWNASTDPDSAVSGYKVYRNGTQIGTSATTTYSDAGLSPSTTYSYTVSAYDPAGNNSAQSASASATTQAQVDTTPPSVPTGLTATAVSSSQINLSWNASTDPDSAVSGYKVYRNGTQIGASASTSYSDTGLSPSTTYTYTVSAYDPSANNSAKSASASATTQASPPPPPPPSDTTPPTIPTGLAATPMSSTQINLSWTASTDPDSAVSGYKVYRNGAQIGTSAYTSYSDSGLSPSTTYTYTVSAFDSAGNNSAQCASVSAKTQATAPPPPPPYSTGMIAFLHLDESAGSALFADSSGSGNNGSCAGLGCPTSGVVGKVGKALSFDGVGDFVTITNNSGLNAFPLTVEAWFKTSSTTGVVGLVNKYVAGSYNGYNVFMNNGNVCAWYLRDSSNYVYDGTGCSFNVAGYNDNAWHQVAYVVDASGGRLYLDGVQKGTLAWTGVSGATTTSQDVQLGHYPGAFGGVEYYTGLLDEVRIYNKALTASDVTALYTADNGPAPDTIPPTVSMTAPPNGATVANTIPVTASASDNVGVVGVQFYLDNSPLGVEVTSAPYQILWDTTKSSNGSHTLTARARDAAGNQSTSAPVTVNVSNTPPTPAPVQPTPAPPDTTPPTVAVTAPAAGATVSATVTVTAAASDNVGVVGVQFLLDGANLGAEATSAPFSVLWNTNSSANGSHTLTAVARDAAGNRTTSAAVPVNVANNAATGLPVVLTSPPTGSTVSGKVPVTATAAAGTVGVRFYVDGVQIGLESNFAPFSVTWDTTTATDGSHTLTAVARDLKGNMGMSAPITVSVVNNVRRRPGSH